MRDELHEQVLHLVAVVQRGLSQREGPGVAEVLARLAGQRPETMAFHRPEPRGLPVLTHLPQAIGETLLLDPDLAAAIVAVADELQWRQSADYTDARLGDGFSANYGWAELIGPHGFLAGDDLLLGLLMLGPERHYRDHYHPAPELYWPLTAQSLWSIDGGPFVEKAQGATIWHPPMALHATITREAPLLALWCWTRDTATPARLKLS